MLSLVRTRGGKRGDVVRCFSYTIVRSVTTRMRIKLEIFSSISLNSWPIGNFASWFFFFPTNRGLKFNRRRINRIQTRFAAFVKPAILIVLS